MILSRRHYTRATVAHSHDHVQLVFGLRGELEFEVEGLGSRVGKQTLAVIPARRHHACESVSGSDCLVLDVPGDGWLDERLGRYADASRRLFERPRAVLLAPAQVQLIEGLAAAPLDDELIVQQSAAVLLASLCGQDAAQPAANDLPVAKLIAHIDRHLAHPLQVDDLARLCGLSSARLHARFLAATGQTPMDFVRQRRLQQGRALLERTRLPVGEIAARVGYASQSAFTAALVRSFDRTPRQLRREAHDETPR